MKTKGFIKQVAVVFALALVVYAGAFYGIEHRRTRNGPWQVTFTNTVEGSPALIINQPKLSLTNIQIVFNGEPSSTNGLATMVFNQPRGTPYEVPFGKCVFMDLISLPGTVALD